MKTLNQLNQSASEAFKNTSATLPLEQRIALAKFVVSAAHIISELSPNLLTQSQNDAIQNIEYVLRQCHQRAFETR